MYSTVRTLPQALQVSARQAAALSGVSETTWWRLHSAGKTPASYKLGGKTLWKLAHLRAWIDWECPDREDFERRLKAMPVRENS